MKSIHIRDIPLDVLNALKRRARTHHRSLQGELKAILEAAARVVPDHESAELDLNFVRSGICEAFDRDFIYGDDDGR